MDNRPVKTVTLKAVRGLRNDVTAERFELGDLSAAKNVDIDATGKIARRKGYVKLSTGNFHSVWSNGKVAYCVKNGVLHRINEDLSQTSLGVNIAGPAVTYANLNNITYWSDQITVGAIVGSETRGWGLPSPSIPGATLIAGDMIPGRYKYACTFSRGADYESGAGNAGSIDVGVAQGISIATLPTTTGASGINLYLSQPNSETLYYAASYPLAGSATIKATPPQNVRIRTQFYGQPRAGRIYGPWMGRIAIASGRFVGWTRPFEYELMAPHQDWWAFEDDVKAVGMVDDGVFVATSSATYFVAGTDPNAASMRQVLPYGAIPGTEVAVTPEFIGEGLPGVRAVIWMSTKGPVLCLPAGEIKNLTSSRYSLPTVSAGAAIFVDRNGMPQYRANIW